MEESTAQAKPSLKGLTVVSFESRLAREMASLIEHYAGVAVNAPSMQEIRLEKNQDVFSFAEKLFGGGLDMMICLTGVGTRALVNVLETRYDHDRIIAALSRIPVVTRGPKPVRVLTELGVPIALRAPEPNTWREIIQALDDDEKLGRIKGRVIAIQEYGKPNDALAEALRRRGALVLRVPVYRWALPDDILPLKSAIRRILAGEVHVCLFTTAIQIHHVMRVAQEEGFSDRLRDAFKGVVVASVGPVCTESLLSFGIAVDIEPAHNKMGALVIETAQKAKAILSEKKQSLRAEAPRRSETVPLSGEAQRELENSPFMKAIRMERTAFTPVWLMRQAGRYLAEYREIRKRTPFLEFCKNRDLVSDITVTAQVRLGTDAAIIFSDILVIVEAMGLELDYETGDGPVIMATLTEGKDVDSLRGDLSAETFSFLYEAIADTRCKLEGDVPLIGFAGAPFTLASYMIEGGTSKTFAKTKAFMYHDPLRWRALMDKISSVLVIFLEGQVKAGVQVVQIFDSWVGCLSPRDYEEYVLPYSSRVIQSLQGKCPVIHFGTGTQSLLEIMCQAGGDVMGVDSRIRLSDAWAKIGFQKAIMGNLDPSVLLADRTLITKRVTEILREVQGRPGHIFNLGHGVLPETPFENARYMVDLVHEISRR